MSADSSAAPMTVALVAAVRDELMPTIHRLGLKPDAPWYVGQRSGKRIVAAFTGVGSRRAIEVFNTMLDEHRPSLVIHAGFAGGLDPALRVASIVVVDWVIDSQGQTYRLNGHIPTATPTAIASGATGGPGDASYRPAATTLLTMDHLVHSTTEKEALFRQHRAAVVDMETVHLARVAQQRGLAMKMVRAVSDPAGMSIPQEAVRWVNADGSHNLPAAVWHLVTRPWKIATTMQLGRNVKLAGANLAQRIEALLSE